MSVFYIDGSSITPNDYTYRHVYDDTIPSELIQLLVEKKKSHNRYIYKRFIKSTTKPTKINDELKLPINSKPNIQLLNNTITKANSLKGFKN